MATSSSGFTPETLPDLLDAVAADLRATFGDVNMTASGRIGQLSAVFMAEVKATIDQLQTLVDALDIENAVGDALDVVAARHLTERRAAVAASAVVTWTGTPATTIPAGTLVSNGDGARFELAAEVIIGGGGTITGTVQCTETGSQDVTAGAIDTIVTPVAGLSSVENLADGDDGRDAETDAEMRARLLDGESTGICTRDGMEDRIRELLPDATQVRVYENTTDVEDGDGIAAHGVAVVVLPDTLPDADVTEAVWLSKPAGIATSGSTTDVYTDVYGVDHDVLWSFADSAACKVRVDLDDVDTLPGFPSDAEDQIKAIVADYFADLRIGDSVRPWRIAALIGTQIDGIGDIEVTAALLADALQQNPVAVPFASTATITAGNITVVLP